MNDDDDDDLHQMITLLLSVMATAPAGAISFSLDRLLFRLLGIVCLCACCRSGEVWSDRKEAEESGNITAVNIKKNSGGYVIGKIRIR